MDSELTKAIDNVAEFDFETQNVWGLGTVLKAARKYANLTESGPIPASQCVFPLVKEELLVYPTDQRVGFGGS